MTCEHCGELEARVAELEAELARVKSRKMSPYSLAVERKRQADRNDMIRERAHHSGEIWTDAEMKIIERTDITIKEMALLTERTYDAVRERRRTVVFGRMESRARRRLNKKKGL